jgi:hypothetical protein
MIQDVIILVFTAAGVGIPVVGRSIQVMSEVSVTHKTVGSRLPRLWYPGNSLTRPAIPE